MISLTAAMVSLGHLRPSLQRADAAQPQRAWLASRDNKRNALPSLPMCRAGTHTAFLLLLEDILRISFL